MVQVSVQVYICSAQSRECVAHSQNPEITFLSRDCALYM